jgi:adenosylcobinamide-GDP ribazoletransferase
LTVERDPCGFVVAVSFLTRVPVRRHVDDEQRLGAAVAWFPTVGIAVGACTAAVWWLCAQVLPATFAAVAAVVAGALVTGGFHEDGLGDTADAFGGGWTRDDVLRILKDSRQGTYGVLAIVAAFAAKVSLLAALPPFGGAAALVGAHALGRGGAVALMGAARPARSEGLGAAYLRWVRPRHVAAALASAAATGAVVLGVWVLLLAAVLAVVVVLARRMAARRIGGVVGDVLGAAEQVGEIATLAVAAAVVLNGWPALGALVVR